MELYNRELTEKFCSVATEKQWLFDNIVENKSWNVAFDKGEITFNKKIVCSIQILGTFSHLSETWLWGWANPDSNFPEKYLITQEY